MSKQLTDDIADLMTKWGFLEQDDSDIDLGYLIPEVISLIVNDMISKLQAEIKG